MTVAYMGVPGAFSHEACLAFLPEERPVGRPSFAAVINAVALGETDFGILPVENNSAGPVEEAQSLLDASILSIVARHVLPIRIHLLGLPGTDLETVKTAVSHPMALKQCARTLAALGIGSQPATNTAIAAQSLSDPAKAVLASAAAADAYGLVILRRDMHDDPDNATTFFVLARAQK